MNHDTKKVTLNDIVDFYLYSYSLYKHRKNVNDLSKHPLMESIASIYNDDNSYFATIVGGTSTNFSEYMFEIWECLAFDYGKNELEQDLWYMRYKCPSTLDTLCHSLQYQNVTCECIVNNEFLNGQYRSIHKICSIDGDVVYIGQFGRGKSFSDLTIDFISILEPIERVITDFNCIKNF